MNIARVTTFFNQLFVALARQERGQTMAEYGILLGVIAIVVVLVAITLGSSISELFSSIGKHL
jgi:Flp pilus assembly pilin Flp